MANYLDITGEEIKAISDQDLRTLIGRLCEADLSRANISTRGVVYGGHQDEADGGIDVMVTCEDEPPQSCFVSRKQTAFQVKIPDMAPARIKAEMQPNGVLRESIRELIEKSGAYIIISSSSSLPQSKIDKRIAAMREVVSGIGSSEHLHLDYVDCDRIATWVRQHPSLVVWVKDKISQPLQGWKSYQNWSNPKSDTSEVYLVDESARVYDVKGSQDEALTVEVGIKRLRDTLGDAGSVVRLVGLSGVGKTRLVQALFDKRVGGNPLDERILLYTDISYEPDPAPPSMLEQLIAGKKRALMIVDNCPPDLHGVLAKECQKPDCQVSLLTVEYDVQTDLPEATNVFLLEPASSSVIENLLLKRFPEIGQINCATLAEISGGNARVAIAIAETVKHGESIAGLQSNDLFVRLFTQRNGKDEKLLESGMACSLVYSFDGNNTEDESELALIAPLADKNASQLYRDIAKMQQRQVMQQRGIWRAVLPHAISNHLASKAFYHIPVQDIEKTFCRGEKERLTKSFARRISYLHDNANVVSLVKKWLSQDGGIGSKICALGDFELDIIEQVASVSPDATLTMLERFISAPEESTCTNQSSKIAGRFADTLWKIAYDAEFFDRAVKVLCRFAQDRDLSAHNDRVLERLSQLFWPRLSGTHAPLEQRIRFIENLMMSQHAKEQNVAIFLYGSLVNSGHRSVSADFAFGSRKRDLGLMVNNGSDIQDWYRRVLAFGGELALIFPSIASKVAEKTTPSIGTAWVNLELFDEIEKIIANINKICEWNRLWIALRAVLNRRRERMSDAAILRLEELSKKFEPVDLLQKVRNFVLSDTNQGYLLSDALGGSNFVDGMHQANAIIEDLGEMLSQDEALLDRLAVEIVTSSSGQMWHFGRGLSKGDADKIKIYKLLLNAYVESPVETRKVSIFWGYINGLSQFNCDAAVEILEMILIDPHLGKHYPNFETREALSHNGLDRLIRSLKIGAAAIASYEYLAMGRRHEGLTDDDLAAFLQSTLAHDGGLLVSIKVLRMRFYEANKPVVQPSLALLQFAQRILVDFPFKDFTGLDHNLSDALSLIAKECLIGEHGKAAASDLCRNYANGLLERGMLPYGYNKLLIQIARSYPLEFLNYIVGSGLRSPDGRDEVTPLSEVDTDLILSWCRDESHERFQLVARWTFPFQIDENDYNWSTLALALMGNAENVEPVIDELFKFFYHQSGSDSRMAELEKRSNLFPSLFTHPNPRIATHAKIKQQAFLKYLHSENEHERAIYTNDHQRFEW